MTNFDIPIGLYQIYISELTGKVYKFLVTEYKCNTMYTWIHHGFMYLRKVYVKFQLRTSCKLNSGIKSYRSQPSSRIKNCLDRLGLNSDLLLNL